MSNANLSRFDDISITVIKTGGNVCQLSGEKLIKAIKELGANPEEVSNTEEAMDTLDFDADIEALFETGYYEELQKEETEFLERFKDVHLTVLTHDGAEPPESERSFKDSLIIHTKEKVTVGVKSELRVSSSNYSVHSLSPKKMLEWLQECLVSLKDIQTEQKLREELLEVYLYGIPIGCFPTTEYEKQTDALLLQTEE